MDHKEVKVKIERLAAQQAKQKASSLKLDFHKSPVGELVLMEWKEKLCLLSFMDHIELMQEIDRLTKPRLRNRNFSGQINGVIP